MIAALFIGTFATVSEREIEESSSSFPRRLLLGRWLRSVLGVVTGSSSFLETVFGFSVAVLRSVLGVVTDGGLLGRVWEGVPLPMIVP
jgi:hypothetical protein